jgi:polysaccharide chain length determinant protein (PEP-CTERM system associated)
LPENVLPEEESGDLGQTIGRVTGVLIRRRWLILLAFCNITLATIIALWTLPNRYTSEATLLVVAQQVPQRYVVPNSTADLDAQLQAMKQEVLSRTRLLQMINDFGLYPKQRRRYAPEQLVGLMLSDIEITPMGEHPQEKSFDAFRISFTTESALLAQQITSTLTSLFINEHLRSQEEQSTNTTKFLHEQVAEKKAKLDEQEQRLREFKMQHVGELPEQQQGNIGILTGLQTQLQNTMASLNRAQQQRVYLQTLIDAQRRASAPVIPTQPGSPVVTNRPLTPLEAAQNDLARLEAKKADLLLSKTREHPDVKSVQREIAKAQEAVQRLKANAPPPERDHQTAATPNSPAKPSVDGADPILAQLVSQLESNKIEIENLTRDETRLKTTVAQYESRLNQTPVREQQQASIVRETEALRLEYSDLQKKEQDSQLATNLEKQQGGQQFRLVDAASLPLVPSSPKRLKQSSLGAVAGIVVGLLLAFGLEMRNTSFRSEKELTKRFDAPFVLSVPVLQTRQEERRLQWRLKLEWLAGSAILFVVLMAEYYVYKRG